jgi:type I restriction-modification system DNA methylase subunit
MSSAISHTIKGRTKPQDVFYTPKELALLHIEMIPDEYKTEGTVWLDPCRGKGVYFDNFPTNVIGNEMDITEEEGYTTGNFLETTLNYKDSVIIGNPPYSIIDEWFKKTIELEPKIFSYLILQHHITPKRLELLEVAGYTMTQLKFLKVYKWYGISTIVTFERDAVPYTEITYNRKVFREDK